MIHKAPVPVFMCAETDSSSITAPVLALDDYPLQAAAST
jgi:hypothetical protein